MFASKNDLPHFRLLESEDNPVHGMLKNAENFKDCLFYLKFYVEHGIFL